MLQFDEFVGYCGKSLLNLKITLNNIVMRSLLILIFLILFCSNSSAQNQLLKRMQKKIEDKVENKIMQKTDKSVDKALDAPFAMPNTASKTSVEGLPSSYNFSWKYDVQIQSQNDQPLMMTYFLQPNASYQGMVLGDIKSDMFVIMDFEREMLLTLMEAGGSKMAQAMSFPKNAEESADENLGDYEISSLLDLVIAGYKCRGMQMKNKEYIIKYYFTNDVPLTLNGMNRDKKDAKLTKIINGINSKDSGLMMKMDMTDLKNKKHNIVMECKSLTRSQKTILKKDYKFM